jgi:DNA-binding CsgD family transcriptional regulator
MEIHSVASLLHALAGMPPVLQSTAGNRDFGRFESLGFAGTHNDRNAMDRRLHEFLDLLSRSLDLESVRSDTLQFFSGYGYPDVAFAYTPEARADEPRLPKRLRASRLDVLYGACGPHSKTAPPETVKRRLVSSTRPFFWCCGMPDVGSNPGNNSDDWVGGARDWAHDYGLSSCLVVPLRVTHAGLPGMAFILSSEAGETFECSMRRNGDALHIASLAAHQRMYELSLQPDNLHAKLSAREIECLSWLSQGLRNDRIAERMRISHATVEMHLANARKKLGAATREQALVKAVMLRLIQP